MLEIKNYVIKLYHFISFLFPCLISIEESSLVTLMVKLFCPNRIKKTNSFQSYEKRGTSPMSLNRYFYSVF